MSNSGASQPRRVRVDKGVYRRRDGKLEIGWRDSTGVQKWRVVQGGITAAKHALAEEHARRGRGEATPVNVRLTFNAAADQWWEVRVPRLRPATRSAYSAGLKHLRVRFGRRRLNQITAADVALYVSDMQASGSKGWTLRGHLTVLSAVYTYATRHMGHVGACPSHLLDRTERPGTDDAKVARILTGDELRRLLDAVDPYYAPLFSLAAETGMRLSEVLGILWSEVDLSDGTVSVTRQLDRSRERSALKTARSRRTLEITPTTAALLRSWKVATTRSADEDYVFVSRKGTPHDHRNIGGRVLARAVERVGMEGEGFTFHAFRHTHASALIAAGWDVAEISARLGHADVATTMRIYAHRFDAARRSQERRDRLSALYSVEAPVEADEAHRGRSGAVAQGAEVLSLLA